MRFSISEAGNFTAPIVEFSSVLTALLPWSIFLLELAVLAWKGTWNTETMPLVLGI